MYTGNRPKHAAERDGHTVRQTATVSDMAEDGVPHTVYADNGLCLHIHAVWSPHSCAAIEAASDYVASELSLHLG